MGNGDTKFTSRALFPARIGFVLHFQLPAVGLDYANATLNFGKSIPIVPRLVEVRETDKNNSMDVMDAIFFQQLERELDETKS